MQMSCSPELVHVPHGRDTNSLPNLRVANPLHLRDAKDGTKTGVVYLHVLPTGTVHIPT